MKRMVRSFIIGLAVGLLATAADKDEEKIYSPIGKRDPFRPNKPALGVDANRNVASLSELERFTVEQYSLKGVLRTTRKATALFEDPDGKVHIVEEGGFLGRERASVSRIEAREVVLTVETRDYLERKKLNEIHLALPEK